MVDPAERKYMYSRSTEGWQFLSQGQSREARYFFGLQAESNPSDGVPKLGYALAAALSGDFNRAEWAMRRAFSISPESLQDVKFSGALRKELYSVMTYYEKRVAAPDNNANDAFMLAALKYIDHDEGIAMEYIEQAIDQGDLTTSATKLRDHLVSVAAKS